MEYGTAGLQDSMLKAITSNDEPSNSNMTKFKKMYDSLENSIIGKSLSFDINDRAKVNLNQISDISKGLAVKSQKMNYDEFEAMPMKYLKMIRDEDIDNLKNELKENESHINGIYLLNNSYTLLHYTILFKKEKVLKLLIELGADVNSRSNMGFSPLHLASRNQDYNMIELLINTYHADKYALDVEGMTYADRLFLAEINNKSKHDNSHAKYREVFKNFNDSFNTSFKYSTRKDSFILLNKNHKNRSVSQETKIKKEVDSNGIFKSKVFLHGLNKIMGTATNRIRQRSR
ncbi:Ankyrin repeat and Ankyrin repeat-containing domain-containing protein [Strongyloides ratti]|uniref:Ankyrin repeat and Ankyrin repeat-containing domain-containing protein n=1 Tax=Strongyloides ratti TaxID=34506 RepID=A0A090LDT7_STRRB|nr:Ankyrin repeat and Ankyrin repeat-containing domain-containing protein [Strongyloides ratti]CEF67927.1 Ankyrin repeat and Ankyrin repeat-containing domain-containing protein [Strongyloides ratti]